METFFWVVAGPVRDMLETIATEWFACLVNEAFPISND